MVPVEEAGISQVEEIFLAEILMDKALSGTDSEEWLDAMENEMASIIKNNTWSLVDRTDEIDVIGSRMILRNKFGISDGRERRDWLRRVSPNVPEFITRRLLLLLLDSVQLGY